MLVMNSYIVSLISLSRYEKISSVSLTPVAKLFKLGIILYWENYFTTFRIAVLYGKGTSFLKKTGKLLYTTLYFSEAHRQTLKNFKIFCLEIIFFFVILKYRQKSTFSA